MSDPFVTFQPAKVPLGKLRLDSENPRLPEQMQGHSQTELAVDLNMGYEAFPIAESIADQGFFGSEPLIVIPSPEKKGTYIVVEGNRRLTALLGIASDDDSIRRSFQDPDQWEELASKGRVTMTTEIPVQVANNRKDVVPVIGYRHITGILAWEPLAQARYIARLVDREGQSFKEINIGGLSAGKVGNLYRDQAIAKQAKEIGFDTGPMESAFSLLTVAMGNTKLRGHVDAPSGAQTKPGHHPIPSKKENDLKELLTWIFGDPDRGIDPAISDSRQISMLANVIGNTIGLAAVRKGESLERAKQLIEEEELDTLGRLIKRLNTARNAMNRAGDDMGEHFSESDVIILLEDLESSLEDLKNSGSE
jgi:hypothetical protein